MFPRVIENMAIFTNIGTMYLFHPVNEVITIVIIDSHEKVQAITGYRMLVILKTPGAIRAVQFASFDSFKYLKCCGHHLYLSQAVQRYWLGDWINIILYQAVQGQCYDMHY